MTSPAKSAAARGRPKGQKIQPILRAATALFMKNGFSETSMDAVVAASGVSKATLYAYFPTKRDLFAAIVRGYADRYSAPVDAAVSRDTEVRTTLQRLARSIVSLMLAPDAVAAHRMVVAEAGRSPELGRLYYESGPARLLARIEAALRQAMERGQLRGADPRQAAEHFIGLVRGNLQLRALMGMAAELPSRQKEKVIKSGIEAFCRAYLP